MAKSNRQRARKMASKGASSLNIQKKTGVSKNAANRMTSRAASRGGANVSQTTQTQRAPFPEAFRNNPTAAANAQYIPNLMVPGNESLGYRPEYNGDGWAAAPGGVDVAQLKDFYKAMAATNNAAIGYGSLAQVRAAAAGYDPSQFGSASTPGGGSGKSSNANMNYSQAMADGKIGRREIQSYMDQKGIKGKKQGNAQMRIANRWSQKGGALGQGVLKDYMGNFEKKNPYSAASLKMGMNPYGVFDAKTKGKSKNDLYKAANSMFEGKGYAKGDVFTRLKDGSLRAQPRMSGSTSSGTTETAGTMTNTSPVNTGTGGQIGLAIEAAKEAVDAGGLYGGGAGAMGATRLGRARSRLRKLGISNEGTNLLGRGLQYGINLNK